MPVEMLHFLVANENSLSNPIAQSKNVWYNKTVMKLPTKGALYVTSNPENRY